MTADRYLDPGDPYIPEEPEEKPACDFCGDTRWLKTEISSDLQETLELPSRLASVECAYCPKCEVCGKLVAEMDGPATHGRINKSEDMYLCPTGDCLDLWAARADHVRPMGVES